MLYNILKSLAKNNISPTLLWDENADAFYIDANTQAKSYLYIYEDGRMFGRYESLGNLFEGDSEYYTMIEDDILKELCVTYLACKHGRVFGNHYWEKLCKKYNVS